MAASLAGSRSYTPTGRTSLRGASPVPNAVLSSTRVAMSSSTPSGPEGCGISSFSGAESAADGARLGEGERGGSEGPRRASCRCMTAGPEVASSGLPIPAKSPTPRFRRRPSTSAPNSDRRRNNPSLCGGRSAAFWVDRILQRILVRFELHIGLRAALRNAHPTRRVGAGSWPHRTAGVTLTHATPTAESSRTGVRIEAKSAGRTAETPIGRLTQR